MGASVSDCSECREPQLYYLPQRNEPDHEFMVLACDRERRQPYFEVRKEKVAEAWPQLVRPVQVLERKKKEEPLSKRSIRVHI
ncbi:unnamed protein product [Effrenium voratum]|uniref:Uncharacterized protein n=1 Tax=Effrenium voratum TaxID=2562239 RepID=A0AA36I976_9DINO|nr:unnamed protein product [Effrenium voratum]CAJ1456305.1 unnamed protein product [Effrenium voratum]|mmetsp:Transcript_90661/g.216466  ORF Transcript_90661/g.216466 Transcript_90661/m.216466 type:complete len:83 (-) Transcript_90661:87-335(-)